MTTPALPQDPQEVRLKAGHLFGQPGVYLSTAGGSSFVPRHCLPDVQRRLAMLARKLEHMPAPTARRAPRKARAESARPSLDQPAGPATRKDQDR